MANKKALIRLEEGSQAISTATGSAELLDAALEKRLGPAEAGDEELPNGGGFVLRIARELAQLHHRYETAREKLARVRDGNVRWREQRDEAFKKLYEATKEIRYLFRQVYGRKPTDVFLGLRGTLPRDPRELYRAVGRVVGRLNDAEWPMPDNQTEGRFVMDRNIAARELAACHRDLGRALAALDEGTKREAVVLSVKKESEEAYKTFYAKGTRLIEATLEFAGFDDLAAAVRPGGGRSVTGIVTPEPASLPAAADPESAPTGDDPPPIEIIAPESADEAS